MTNGRETNDSDTPRMKKVGIVILNYKNWQDTLECLEAVLGLTYDNCDTVVVDNDSRNDSLSHIGEWLSGKSVAHELIAEENIGDTTSESAGNVTLIQASANGGYASGNNLGIRLLLLRRADYFFILNNDTVVEKGCLEPLVEYAENHESVGLLGPKLVDEQGRPNIFCARRRPKAIGHILGIRTARRLFPNSRWYRSHYYLGEYDFDVPREVDVISGSCMLITRSVITTAGPLDENTFLFSEEFILHEKLRGIRMKTVVVPDSQVVHKHGQSTKRSGRVKMLRVELASMNYYLTQYRQWPKVAAFLLLSGYVLESAFVWVWNRLIGRLPRSGAPCAPRTHIP